MAAIVNFGSIFKKTHIPVFFWKLMLNKNSTVLNIIESHFLHQTKVDFQAMGHVKL